MRDQRRYESPNIFALRSRTFDATASPLGSGRGGDVHSEHWKLEPDDHDFPAAAAYLSLICEPTLANQLVKLLKSAPSTIYQAKDLLRSSDLALLSKENLHVAKDLAQVKAGHKLSPVLLVRGRFTKGRALVIADGYHRICASYWINENSQIPCRIVDVPN